MTEAQPVVRSSERVRLLTADELGIGSEAALAAHSSNRADDPPLDNDDPRLQEVRGLLPTYGGVIFTGPPGTSKTWYAAKIASKLAGDETRVAYVQFHPSYQYEDFIEGYVPQEDGDGFTLRPKHFVEMCLDATKDPDHLYVLVIDELSRGDPGRVFGEALTYVERSKRQLGFTLASGRTLTVPDNVFIIATMNPLDRGVDEVDAAFERRFAKIAMEPDIAVLERLLDANSIVDPTRRRVISFFRLANGLARTNPHAAIGHTFFADISDEAGLRSLWEHQLRFLVEKAYRLDLAGREQVEREWNRIFVAPDPAVATGANDDAPESAADNDRQP